MALCKATLFGQCAHGDVAADTQMIELGLMRAQTGFDVAETLAGKCAILKKAAISPACQVQKIRFFDSSNTFPSPHCLHGFRSVAPSLLSLDDAERYVFTASEYDAKTGEWHMSKLPLHHIIT